MGFTILVASDDTALRRKVSTVQGGRAALEELGELLGSNTYPRGDDTPRTVGSWSWAGTAHSSALVLCEASDSGVRKLALNDTPGVDTPSLWVAPPTPRQWSEAEFAVSRGKNLAAAAAIAAGLSPDVALFGDDLLHTTTTGVWQVYADMLPARFTDADASSLALMLTTRRATPGMARSAVLRVGGVAGPLPPGCSVHLVCSGNRVCRPVDLTDTEQRSLAVSGYRP